MFGQGIRTYGTLPYYYYYVYAGGIGMSVLKKQGIESVLKLERGGPPPLPPSVTREVKFDCKEAFIKELCVKYGVVFRKLYLKLIDERPIYRQSKQRPITSAKYLGFLKLFIGGLLCKNVPMVDTVMVKTKIYIGYSVLGGS